MTEVVETRTGDRGSMEAIAAEVDRVIAACADADGISPLNEQSSLALKHHGFEGARLWLARSPGTPVEGFALLRDGELDLAVHPRARSHGVGTALAAAVCGPGGPGRGRQVQAWSHADHPAAARLAARFGLHRQRELLIMSRPTSRALDDVPIPAGVRLRGFRPADEAAVLAVNAAAFAHHPEQGEMTATDFRERAGEAWFDPAGLILALSEQPAEQPAGQPAEELLGFHWTKVHTDEQPPLGEVYVLGVAPAHAGRGLGKVLTIAGLRHLADAGVREVILYVEGDNTAALGLYRGLGFAHLRTEAQYAGRINS